MSAEREPPSEGRRRLRVAHLITNLDTGGAETSLVELCRGLAGQIDTTVITLLERGVLADEAEAAGARVIALRWRRSVPSPLGLRRLVKVLDEEQPDLVQGWMYQGNLAAWAALRWLRFPASLVWNLRQTPGDWASETPLTAASIRASALFSDRPAAIVVNALANRDAHAALGYRPARWVWIPNGFDLERFRPDHEARQRVRCELGAGEQEILVGLVARAHPVKGQRRFLEAAAMLGWTHRGVSFVLAGRDTEAEQTEIAAWIEALGLRGRVRCLGERRDIPDLMNALDIVCLASTSESFPNTVGEAMACGRPVVSTPVGDVAHLVGDAGVVAADLSPDALASAVEQVLRLDERERARLGTRARRRIERRFSHASMIEHYRALYHELTALQG